MSRRKRGSSAHNTSRAGPGRQRESSPDGRPGEPQPPPLTPPRPNRGFLAVSALLLAGWIAFLAVLALTT